MKKIMEILTIILTVSLLIIISYYLSMDIPEWFGGAGYIFEFFKDLSLAFIASYIFFLIVQYVPYSKKRNLAELNLDIVLYRINFNMEQLISYLVTNLGEEIKKDNDVLILDEKKILNSREFDFSKEAMSSFFVGSQLVISKNLSAEVILNKIIVSIINNIKKIEKNYEYIDEDLIDILMDINNCDLIESISFGLNKNILEQILNVRKEEVRTFYLMYIKLIKYIKSHKYPIKYEELKNNYN